jgi:transaldolase
MDVKIFADGADKAGMLEMYNNPLIKGFTTNPTLMRKAGITNYKAFALDILSEIKDKPISFEVFSDDFNEMFEQAKAISSWGNNVYVKIPITNTKGESSRRLIRWLTCEGARLNITAITTVPQVNDAIYGLDNTVGAYISIFAGRIADTGIDPIPTMKGALNLIKNTNIELIWASPREVLNVVQANNIGCHVITCTNDIIKKLPLLGRDLTEYSLDTVKMFYNDSKGFCIR